MSDFPPMSDSSSLPDAPTGRDSRSGSSALGTALGVSEFALLQAACVTPVGPVMGGAVHWLATALPSPTLRPLTGSRTARLLSGGRYEGDVTAVPELDDIYGEVRRNAFARLGEQALAAGANLVLNIRQIPGTLELQQPTAKATRTIAKKALSRPYVSRAIDYQLVGVAVRVPDYANERVSLSNLTVAEFCKLRAVGWEPVGAVGGCAYVIGANVFAGYVAREVEGGTALWHEARSKALAQVTAEARELAADGVMAMAMSTEHQGFGLKQSGVSTQTHALLVGVSATATAVRRTHAGTIPAAPTRVLVLR